jgi:hypothetical protein
VEHVALTDPSGILEPPKALVCCYKLLLHFCFERLPKSPNYHEVAEANQATNQIPDSPLLGFGIMKYSASGALGTKCCTN